MMHLAIHDALNAIDRRYQPYAYDTKAEPGTSPDAAVAAAAYYVLVPTIQTTACGPSPRDGCKGEWRRSRRSGLHGWLWPWSLMVQRRPRGLLWERLRRRQPLRSEPMITSIKGPFLNTNCPPAGPAWNLSVHTGTTRQVHRLREMGKRHPLRAPGQYPIPTWTAVQGGRCEVQGRPRRGEEAGR